MELYFVCPVTGREYASENWQIVGELHVREGLRGDRTLVGSVSVECPYCRSVHTYCVEDLACPWTRAGR